MSSLLPPNATKQELALEATLARIEDIPILIRNVWNPDTCPAEFLPWLAWSFSVDEWDNSWTEEAKRQTIRDAVQIQRRKGSVWAVKRVLAAAGFGEGILIEGNSAISYDGTKQYDGLYNHGNSEDWASYRFIASRQISYKESLQIRKILEETAPARCHLIGIFFTPHKHDGTIYYNGENTYGAA